MISDLGKERHPRSRTNLLITKANFFLALKQQPLSALLYRTMVSSPAAVISSWAEAISHFLCCYIIKPPPWTLSNPGGGFFYVTREFPG